MNSKSKIGTRCLLLLVILGGKISFSQVNTDPNSISNFNLIPLNVIRSSEHTLLTNEDSLNPISKSFQRWAAYNLPFSDFRNDDSVTFFNYSRAIDNWNSFQSNCNSDLVNWKSIGPVNLQQNQYSGWIDGIVGFHANPTEYIVGTRTSGLFKTLDGGATWKCVTDSISVPALGTKRILTNPSNPNQVIYASGTDDIIGKIFISNDRGNTWPITLSIGCKWFEFINDLPGYIVGCTKSEVFIMDINNYSYFPLGLPNGIDLSYAEIHKVQSVGSKIIINTKKNYTDSSQVFLYDRVAINDPNFPGAWSSLGEICTFLTSGTMSSVGFTDFSNTVNSRMILRFDGVTNSSYYARLYFMDSNNNFTPISTNNYNLQGGRFSKNLMILSENNPNIFYIGGLDFYKYTLTNNAITNHSNINGNGHHDDYRSGMIMDNNGEDLILLGNDGGPAKIMNGLSPTSLLSIKGDLSINLIHAFHVHERTKQISFGFQDHRMLTKFNNGTFSSPFFGEGSVAYNQKEYPSNILGENTYDRIRNHKLPAPNEPLVSLVNSNAIGSGGYYLGGYFVTYRNYPQRFLRGVNETASNSGGVILNRNTNVSLRVSIPNVRHIGPIGICENDTNVIYISDITGLADQNKLLKSVDAGLSWQILSNSTINLGQGPLNLNFMLSYKSIRAITVHHYNPNILYIGVDKVYTENDQVINGKFRVLKSTDGGVSFDDFSEGLPAVPVERLLTLDSRENIIICATSLGVFYRMDGMTQWECISTKLPKAKITGIQFDYCSNELYVSTYGRGLWKTSVNFQVSSYNDLTIGQNTTWTGDIDVEKNVRITSGATLHIQGANLNIFPYREIVVEKGAKILIDNSTITNSCDLPWQGIRLIGDWNLPQTDINQGVLEINNSLIENSIEAVIPGNFGDFTENGGIIRATNTNFRNNNRSAQFLTYPAPNQISNPLITGPYNATFTNCSFEWDNNCLFESPQGVTMYQVKGVNFLGCDFVDTRTNISETSRARGIFTIDAGFGVLGRVTSPSAQNTDYFVFTTARDNNTFRNLKTGIEALQSNSLQSVRTDYSIFENCRNGVILNNNMNSMITRSLFNYSSNSTYTPTDPIGLTLNTANGFTVEGNIFKNDSGVLNTTGTLVLNSGPDDNQIRRNQILNTDYGNLAIGLNRSFESSTATQRGLSYLCNIQNQNNVDIEVRGSGNEGVRLTQGNTFESAQNSFSNGYAQYNFNNSANNIVTYFSNSVGSNPQNVVNVNISNFNVANQCTSIFNKIVISTSELGGVQEISQITNNLTQQIIGRDIKLAALEAKLELGNAPTLYIAIENMNIINRELVKSQLDNLSPYLNIEVLKKLGNTPSSIFPHEWYRDLIIANIEVAKLYEFREFLKNKIEPIPSTIMQEIENEILISTTQRGKDIAEVASMNSEIESWNNILISNYLLDSTQLSSSKVLSQLQLKESEFKDLYEIDHLLTNGEIVTANTRINILESKAYLPENVEHKEFWLNFVEFKRFYLSILNENSVLSLPFSDEEISTLIFFRDNGLKYISNQAGNLLCFFNGICENQSSVSEYSLVSNLNKNQDLTEYYSSKSEAQNWHIYPNPAQELIVVGSNNSNTIIKHIEVLDGTGRILIDLMNINSNNLEQINISNLKTGSYYVRITDNYNQTETQIIFKQ